MHLDSSYPQSFYEDATGIHTPFPATTVRIREGGLKYESANGDGAH